ncbi:MAG: hypothetical protein ACLRQF_14965 [Thomasclavelia ramosa]
MSAAESQVIAAGGFNASAASLLVQMTNLLTSITANSTAIASMQKYDERRRNWLYRHFSSQYCNG